MLKCYKPYRVNGATNQYEENNVRVQKSTLLTLEGNQMPEIIIDEEFRILLPVLDGETFRLLEDSILTHGCRDPLVLWNNTLIDGYNRYKICRHQNIPFTTVNMEFDSRDEVLIWIISNQVARRNLTPIQLSHFRGLHYRADKNLHGDSSRFAEELPRAQNGPLHSGSTATRLANDYNVSRNTIKRDAKLAETLTAIGLVSPEAKRKILAGEVQINKSKLEVLSSASEDDIEEVALQIEEDEYKGRTNAPTTGDSTTDNSATNSSRATKGDNNSSSILPEIQQLNLIIKDFANDFNSMFLQLRSGDPIELKPLLRSYIDQLEDLYKSMS
jgi:hypothetical protein